MTKQERIQNLLPDYLDGKSAEELIYNAAAGLYTAEEFGKILAAIKENVVDRRTGRTTKIVDTVINLIFPFSVGRELVVDDHYPHEIGGLQLKTRIASRLLNEFELIQGEDFEISSSGSTVRIKKLREF